MVDLAELVPSKDVREYMEKKGRILTDFEKAILIYNHPGMCFAEKTAHLKDIMMITDDGDLKEEIRERLSYDAFVLAHFSEGMKNVFMS